MKSVIRQISPATTVIDITHEIAPHDVRAGGLALARSAQYLAPGVVLAVVDPGVGTTRRGIAVEVGQGESVLVGPDNGLLAPAVALVGGAGTVVELTSDEHRLSAPGPTFDGRDVFAPAAAHICNGVPIADLGPEVDAAGLVPGLLALTRQEGEGLAAEVLWVDRFGNAQLNVDPEELTAYGSRVQVRSGDARRVASRARTYADLGAGELGLVVDSYGMVSLALDRRSAADELGIAAGSAVNLDPLPEGDDGRSPGTTTRVTLGDRASR